MDSMASGRSARLPATPSINVRSFESNHNYQGGSMPNSAFSTLGPELATATSQVLDNLTERERQMILTVLHRDEGIRQREAARIMLLRAELQNLRRRGAIKIEAGSLDRPTIETQRSCSRCCSELGRIINRGAPCRSCRLRVCKACREFTTRTTDWVCIVCHKQMELQSATGEWMNEYARRPPRRDSSSEVIKKSIRRSWTISSPQNEYLPHIRNGAEYRNYSSLPPSQEISNYPSLMQHQVSAQMQFSGDKAQDYIDDVNYDVPQQRRILRQSTLPNPEVNNYFGNNNLLPPGSPKQQLSPQYSPYNTDNENMMDLSDQEVPPTAPPRFTIRRQSTLPCRPNEHHASVKYSSTSPSRSFSRSPEKSDTDQPRCPPFRRQSTFPSNSSEQLYPPHQRPKLLPTSPSRLVFSKSPDNETTEQAVRYQMHRQSTLPNPDQHLKLLPTSPPKMQLSPQYMKRSPEFARQNTLPNPDTMTSLSIHHGGKFLPISPRQKQNFLFPQPQNPRPFLSQQNFPTMEDQGSTQSIGHRDQSKMIKVRSHSNEEYSARSCVPPEGRRLLPEIPTRRSPRLVRQEHVKEDLIRSNSEQRSPIKRTFAEAKQNLMESFDEASAHRYDYPDHRQTYLETDENYLETSYDDYETSDQGRYQEETKTAEDKTKPRSAGHPVRSTESFLNDSSPEYFHPDEYIRSVKKERTRRRRSRELIEPELMMSSNDEEPTFKRSDTVKVPSPKPLAELLEKQKKEKLSKLPSPRRKNYKSLDLPDSALSSGPKALPLQKRDSRSLEAVMKTAAMSERLRNALDDNKSQSLDEGIFNESDERKASICDEEKRKLPEHKTTLGEAEIQSAVEAAAVIFKKVVLQRRNAKKAAEEGGDTCSGARNRKSSLMQDDISDYENCTGLKMLYPDTDEYKLVFISSDSSSKEEEFEDSSSTTSSVNTRHSFSLDDCDWDYFEPGVGSRAIFRDFSVSPFDSPSVRRKHFKSSPMTSPIFYRRGLAESPFMVRQRLRESDTGTDEEVLAHAESSSPTSSDGFMNQELVFMKNHRSDKVRSVKKECTCGGTTVFVPIPVLIPPNWNPSDLLVQDGVAEIDDSAKQKLRAIQQRQVDIFQLWNSAALQSEGKTESASGFRNTEPDRASTGPTVEDCTVEAVSIEAPAQEVASEREVRSCDALSDSVSDKVLSLDGAKHQKVTRETPEVDSISESAKPVGSEVQVDMVSLDTHGYLQAERVFSSDSDSSHDSDEGDLRPIRRSYNVTGEASDNEGDGGVSDVGQSDNERHSVSSSAREDPSSSETEATDSDDTGTVADRRPKSKRFSRVFVVNRRDSSSDSQSSDGDTEDSSDNDTDTEKDCGIILNYVKEISDRESKSSSDSDSEDSEPDEEIGENSVILNYIRCLDDEDNPSPCVVLNSVKFFDEDEVFPPLDSLEPRGNGSENGNSENSCDEENEEEEQLCAVSDATSSDKSAHVADTVNTDETLASGVAQVASECCIEASSGGSQRSSVAISDEEDSQKMEESHGGAESSLVETESAAICSSDLPTITGELPTHAEDTCESGEGDRVGDHEAVESERPNSTDAAHNVPAGGTKYTSLVMITQDTRSDTPPAVNIVATDTTRIVSDEESEVIVHHTNSQEDVCSDNSLAGYFMRALGEDVFPEVSRRRPVKIVNESVQDKCGDEMSESDVTVVTGANTLSAVISLEEGLADDDSWVEEISNNDEEEFTGHTATDSDVDSSEEITLSSTIDREEELRGYNRTAIDFTLHTIVEESCEESEVEQSSVKNKYRVSASDLEKYFFYGLGDGKPSATVENREDSLSESSSICSEGMDSLGPDDQGVEPNPVADLTASRLEKYFLSGFMGFSAEQADSDGSGSVGSDSEGRPSPEQRRKKLVRARGSGRSHSSSLDNLLAKEDSAPDQMINDTNDSNDSSETDTCDENTLICDKDGQSDTIKRKKQNKKPKEESDLSDEEGRKTPQPEFLLPPNSLVQSRKQHSRDSGFVGSNDDLLKTDDSVKSSELKVELEEIEEENRSEMKETECQESATKSTPPSVTLTRKDSFNNWSSDEETNVMMSKMRQFFKTLVAASANAQSMSTKAPPVEVGGESAGTPVAKPRNRSKPPQLVYFESELTRLMKTVPGINDEQVREIVEYLSSEDTWSDSYDSSDYTSSDLEGAGKKPKKSELQEQISASCQQIINKFDSTVDHDEEGDRGDGGLLMGETPENPGLNRETAFVYQKLVASFSKIAAGEEKPATSTGSPPIFAKVIHHIGSRLVALMHEVSSGESHTSSSPRGAASRHHRRLQAKISATTTEDDDSTSDSAMEKPEKITFAHLPRSKSHDLLLGESRPHHQSSSGVSDTTAEEKEASDYERFSWRGSFESALLANGDSRTKLTLLDHSSSASALAAKRRSAGDLLFNQKSLSREQLDRVRSCGSIGGGMDHEIEGSKLWGSATSQKSARRRSSVPDAACDSDNDSSEDERRFTRSTLPRSLQTTTSSSTNSLPRLSTSNLASSSKQHSVYHFLQNNVKSARYRAPGFARPTSITKKPLPPPGQHQSLTSVYQRRDGRRKVQSVHNFDENPISPEVVPTSPVNASKNVPSGGPTSPAGSRGSASSDPWPSQSDEDIDRLVALHQNRHSLSSLGLRSDSMASVYSGAGEGRYGTVVVKGNIEFGMQYNYKQNALEIHIVQCKELAAVDCKRNRSDPYVKVYLLPDKSKSGKRKTKVKKHTLNPFFDEVLKFHMSISSLESRTLWLTVWHSDMFGRNDFLGEVLINLQGKLFDNPQPQWYQLQERSEPFDEPAAYRGDIIVALKFVPPDSGHNLSGSLRKFSKASITTRNTTKGQLHVLVKEAKNLMPVKANGTCDAFCKSYLLPEKSRSSKRKTDVIKRTVNPVWNHTIVYEDVTLQELSERALELTIWDHDRLASNEFLGGVRFSLGTGKHYGRSVEWMDATGKELSLWQSMLNRPNFWVEGCLVLRSSIDTARNSL